MRIAGVNLIAVLVAAVLIYAIGFVIYGLLFSQLWMDLHGYTKEDLAGAEMWRMYLSPVMPILIAFGVGIAHKWRGGGGLMAGLTTGAIVWLCFLFPTRMYSFVYGLEAVGLFEMDSAHLLADALVAGAVFGLWPNRAA